MTASTTDRTEPVPTTTTTAPFAGSSGDGGSAEPPQAPAQRPSPADRPRRRWADVAVASLLAATLASGGTYAAVRAADGDAGGTTTQQQDAVAGSADDGTQATNISADPASDWTQVASSVTPSVVSIEIASQQGQGAGSGVVWDTEGHIVTNAHVVSGAQEVHVTLADGRTYSATVLGEDASSDLAVLKLTNAPDGLSPISVGQDSALAVGDPVMAVGNPLGLSGTVTTGIVSALDRPVTTQSAESQAAGTTAAQIVTNAIQTSAAINPGNSGGALVNAAGELVGINSSIASIPSFGQSQPGSIGIGFAIPSGKVQLIVDQLISTGSVQHAFLGVGLNDGQAEVDGATLTGAQVEQVEPNSPASDAGLQTGDLIVGIDGEHVPSATALVGQVRERGTGDTAQIEYIRDGARAEATVTLATRPDEG
ncbi:S1C family serine protease [Ornithinimicrobium sp. Y1847]|uniref:S1C family serine protease n=1 Tax=Ornithinimicrobium sp. Y1847 TaxID=3405419 RepID=UPI003B685A40